MSNCAIGSHKLNRVKIHLLEVVFFYYVLFLGGATPLINNLDIRSNPLGAVIYFAALGVLISRAPKPLVSRKLVYVLIVLSVWFAIHFFLDGSFKYLQYGILGLNIITGYFIIRVYRASIVKRIVKTVYVLSIIALGMWLVELWVGIDVMQSLAPFANTWGEGGGSFLVFNVQPHDYKGTFVSSIIRNSGFAWEPGRFASIIVIAFTCNIIWRRGQFKLLSKYNIVFLLALITTFSTTGYVAMLTVFAINLISSPRISVIKKTVLGLTFVLIAVFTARLSFVSEKILDKADSESFFTQNEQIISRIDSDDEQFTVDRFEGLGLDLLNFKEALVFGYGLDPHNSYVGRDISEKLVTSNGIVKPFAMYGFPLAITFFLFFFLGTKRLSQAYSYKMYALLFIAIMIVSISYNWIDSPLMLAITLYGVLSCRCSTKLLKIKVWYNG